MNSEILTLTFLAFGLFFVLIGCFGLYRMPDVFCRMHAATKTTTLGLGLTLIATSIHLGFSVVGLKAVLAILFAFLTAPVGAHLISRAAYQRGVKLHDRSITDALQSVYPNKGQTESQRDKD